MRVEIRSGGLPIGVGELRQIDASMGVAFGPFTPMPSYSPSVHAAVLGGRENVIGAQANLTAHGTRGLIECEGVGIHDGQIRAGEIEVTLFGIVDVEGYFGEHRH